MPHIIIDPSAIDKDKLEAEKRQIIINLVMDRKFMANTVKQSMLKGTSWVAEVVYQIHEILSKYEKQRTFRRKK